MTSILAATIALAFTSTALAHPRVTGITPAGKKIRASVYRTDPCLARIIERETGGTWDPRIYNGFGHWHPGDPPSTRSYGLPQAQPPEKMARYSYTVGRHRAGDPTGGSWRTDPWVQIAWAKNYAIGRYGSTCDALNAWLRKGWY